jgi:pimeloyl-ACP methyl ester carboxylesterase
MEGRLHLFDKDKRLPVFISGGREEGCEYAAVFLGGLTDGLLALPYLPELQAALSKHKPSVALCQPLFSSSYNGYGCSSLGKDVEELAALLRFLQATQRTRHILLIGHSTGCQIICRLYQLQSHHPELLQLVVGAVLQGPVSDREYLATQPHIQADLRFAQDAMLRGEGFALLPRRSDGDVPMSAARMVALAARGGEDDMFSSDLTDQELTAALGCIAVPTLIVCSGSDEYVPSEINLGLLTARLARACAQGHSIVLPGAPHSLAGFEQPFLAALFHWLDHHVFKQGEQQ